MAGAWASATDLARIYKVTVPTIRRWAREDHWHHRGNHPRRYAYRDAQASYDKRHTAKRHLHLQKHLTDW